MNIVITKIDTIKSKKDNAVYKKIHFISEDSSVGEIFVNEEKFNEFGLSSTSVIPVATIKALFDCDDIKVSEVYFNQLGRVDSLK